MWSCSAALKQPRVSQFQGCAAGNNNLTGSIPNVVAATSKLQVLTLYNNQLTGTIPSTIGNAQHPAEL